MRLVYLDEAGVGNPDSEPILVVAGVIVEADTQWKLIEREMDALVERVPEKYRRNFVFSAKDIFNGKRYQNKETGIYEWSREDRWSLLEEICQIVVRHKLPVPYGMMERNLVLEMGITEDDWRKGMGAFTVVSQAVAFIWCTYAIETWMQENTHDEVAMVIAEDRAQIKGIIKTAHQGLKHPSVISHMLPQFKNLPVQKIIDTVHFADKPDSRPLQLADTCAFIIRRALAQKADIMPCFEILGPYITPDPRTLPTSPAWGKVISEETPS